MFYDHFSARSLLAKLSTNRAGPSFYEDRQAGNFPTSGRPPCRHELDGYETGPPQMDGHETRNTMYSGIEYTEEPYRPAHAQLVGRKRRADDDTLLMPCTEVPDSARRMQWDGPHKRILFESEDPDSTSSGSGIQEARPRWPQDNPYQDSTQYRGSTEDRDREELRLPGSTLEQRLLRLQKKLESDSSGIQNLLN